MSDDNEQRVAIITGGSQGIGAGLVAGYRRRGWAVVDASRTVKPAQDPAVLNIEADVSEPAAAGRIMSEALARFGRVDTLVNNAGIFVSKPFTDYTADDYAAMVGVNLTGFFWLTQHAIAEMLPRGSGHIVNITTTLVDYASSSAPSALTAMTKGGLAAATTITGHRVRLPRHPGQRRLAGHHPDADAPAGKLRRARPAASSGRACGPGQRHRRRHLVPGVLAVHHGRDPAHRRRPDRRPLTERHPAAGHLTGRRRPRPGRAPRQGTVARGSQGRPAGTGMSS